MMNDVYNPIILVRRVSNNICSIDRFDYSDYMEKEKEIVTICANVFRFRA